MCIINFYLLTLLTSLVVSMVTIVRQFVILYKIVIDTVRGDCKMNYKDRTISNKTTRF